MQIEETPRLERSVPRFLGVILIRVPQRLLESRKCSFSCLHCLKAAFVACTTVRGDHKLPSPGATRMIMHAYPNDVLRRPEARLRYVGPLHHVPWQYCCCTPVRRSLSSPFFLSPSIGSPLCIDWADRGARFSYTRCSASKPSCGMRVARFPHLPRLQCWGGNGKGQLGYEDTETRGNNPESMGDALGYVDLGTGRTAVTITAGDQHTCAILDNTTLKVRWGFVDRCWGCSGPTEGSGSPQLSSSPP